MRAVDIIVRKRDRFELSEAEINYFIQAYAAGEIPDYQASAWAMAVLLNGMTPGETKDLTLAIANSGEKIDLTGVVPIAVDKHSTGGVGDKTTLVVEPTVAACGLPVGKMSGRGLGFTGGTLDKMESIPGFRTDLSRQEFIQQLRTVGLVLSGQTGDLAPADGKLYALRDVTGTVQSIPLIASSVMSKKIAAGAQCIVLDVKVGSGAFMKNLAEARQLAEMMVSIARLANRKALALISDMNQPLGFAVGNALELIEAIETLQGGGPQDFREHCLQVAASMLVLADFVKDEDEGREKAAAAIRDGRSWERFRALVHAQGGDVVFIDQPERLEKARIVEQVLAPQSGFLSEINALTVGEMSLVLGAGRAKKGDPIDHAVGLVVHHKIGERVEKGEPLFTIHANQERLVEEVRQPLLLAHRWSEQPVPALPLFYDVVR